MADTDHRRQLLVAASPHDGIADTHWFREEVDHFFVKEAEKIGVDYFDESTLHGVLESESEIRVEGRRGSEDICIHANFLVDATGPRGFLHHALKLGEVELPDFPKTQALFSHFSGVGRIGEQVAFGSESGEMDSSTRELPPYPVDDAAVHHVFEGGWVWVLKFNNGITSAGVAATEEFAERLKFSEGGVAWQRLLELLPALKEQFAGARATRPFVHMPRLAFRCGTVAGKRWALLPSAAGFVDPLLSTGFPLTLLGVSRLAEIIERDWNTPQFGGNLRRYATQTDEELLAAGRLLANLYSSMGRFPVFVAQTMLYFAAASFSESARRLGKAHLASSFLLHDDPGFGPEILRSFQMARDAASEGEMRKLAEEVSKIIEPINVAGLGCVKRRNWYPVDAEDLLNAAGKLDSTKDDIVRLLEKCGFYEQRAMGMKATG